MKATHLRRWLAVAFTVIALQLVSAGIARADKVDDFLFLIDKCEELGVNPFPVSAQEIRDMRSVFTCLDGGQDVVTCAAQFSETSTGAQMWNEADLPSWVGDLLNAYVEYREGNFWGVVRYLGEAAVCAVAQVLSSVDVCGVIEQIVRLVESIWEFGEAFVQFLKELGEAIVCDVLGWIWGGCDGDSVPTYVLMYQMYFEHHLGDALAAIEVGDEGFTALSNTLKAECVQAHESAHASGFMDFGCLPGEENQAAGLFRTATDGLWDGDMVQRVIPLFEEQRNAYREQHTQAFMQLAFEAASQGRPVFAEVRDRCVAEVPGACSQTALMDRWMTVRGPARVAQLKVKKNYVWCSDVYRELQKTALSGYFASQLDAACPLSGDRRQCYSATAYEACKWAAATLAGWPACVDAKAQLDATCPSDGQGQRVCTSLENYDYCRSTAIGPYNAVNDPDEKCVFGAVAELDRRCPVDPDGQGKRACQTAEDWAYCRSVLGEVNYVALQTGHCGWTKQAADAVAQSIQDYFVSQGSKHPCAATGAHRNHDRAQLSCKRPVQRARCEERSGVFVYCTGTNDPAYDALAGQVASEVAQISARNNQLTTAPLAAARKLTIGAPDVLAVSVGSTGVCTTLSNDTTIPGTLFATPSGPRRFEFDCDTRPGSGPPAPGANVDGFSIPRISVQDYIPLEVTDAVKKETAVNTDIRAVGQKKVGPGPVEELVQARDRVRDGDMLGVDVQHTDTQHVGTLTPGAAQPAKVAGKLATGQTATGKLSPGQAALNAARPEEEETGRRNLVAGTLAPGQAAVQQPAEGIGKSNLAGATVLTGAGQVAEPAQMAPMMGQAPAGAAPSGAAGTQRSLPPPPTSKPDITAATQVAIANRTAEWNVPLTLDTRDALRKANGVCLFTLRYTARNIGVAPASAFSSTLTNSAVPTPSERLWPGLASGDASTQSDVVSLKPGMNTLTLWLDQKNEVQETNEGNNQSRLPVNVTGTCEAAARVVRPGTTVAVVPVNPVTRLPAIRPPTTTPSAPATLPTPVPAGGVQVNRPGTLPKVPTIPAPAVPVRVAVPGTLTPGALATPTPAGLVARIDTPGMLTPVGLSPDLVAVAQLTIGRRAVDWNGAASLDTKDAQRAAGGVCTFGVRYSVRNAGAGPGGAFESALTSSTGGASADASWAALAAGAQSGRSDALDLKPGLNVLTLTLDGRNQVKESNETNNQSRLQVSVSGTCTAAAPPPATLAAPLVPKALAMPAPAKKK